MLPRVSIDHRQILEDHYLFSTLPSSEIDKIMSISLIRQYPKNSTIFVRLDEGDRLFAILRGRVKISVFSDEGREVVLALLSAGSFFGEIAALDGSSRTGDASVLEDSDILSIGRKDLMPVLERNPEIYMKIIRILCERLRATNETVEDSVFLTIPARLAKTVAKLSSTYGEPYGESIRIRSRISQQELANIIGTSREVVNRYLRQLQQQEVIRIEKGHIIIDKREYLEDFTRN